MTYLILLAASGSSTVCGSSCGWSFGPANARSAADETPACRTLSLDYDARVVPLSRLRHRPDANRGGSMTPWFKRLWCLLRRRPVIHTMKLPKAEWLAGQPHPGHVEPVASAEHRADTHGHDDPHVGGHQGPCRVVRRVEKTSCQDRLVGTALADERQGTADPDTHAPAMNNRKAGKSLWHSYD